MGRKRKLSDLRGDAYKRADCEGATDRHPPADVARYINQGRAALRDLMIAARGRSDFRKKPAYAITTTADTSQYPLPSDFYQLISVRIDGDMGDCLEPFTPLDEPFLRAPGASNAEWPSHYELQESDIELLPLHRAGVTVVLDYIPVLTDLADDDDEADGVDGWEDYIVDYAALRMASKDDERALVRDLEASMAQLEKRIASLAPKRDRFRAERVKDVRGTRMFGWRGR